MAPNWMLPVGIVMIGAATIAYSTLRLPGVGFVMLVVSIFGAGLVLEARRRRFRRWLERMDGLVCLRCHYPLGGLPSPGVCPECREPYEHGSLQRIWKLWQIGQRDPDEDRRL
jgi:hypothetical protein